MPETRKRAVESLKGEAPQLSDGVKLLHITLYNVGLSLCLCLICTIYLSFHSLLTFLEFGEDNIPRVIESRFCSIWIGIAFGFLFGFQLHYYAFEYKGGEFIRGKFRKRLGYRDSIGHFCEFPHGRLYFHAVYIILAISLQQCIVALFDYFDGSFSFYATELFYMVLFMITYFVLDAMNKSKDSFALEAAEYNATITSIDVFDVSGKRGSVTTVARRASIDLILEAGRKISVIEEAKNVASEETNDATDGEGENVDVDVDEYGVIDGEKITNDGQDTEDDNPKHYSKSQLVEMNKKKGLMAGLLRYWTFTCCVVVLLFYPFTAITLFLSSDYIGRCFIVLFVHPIMMEVILIAIRANSGNGNKGKPAEPARDYISTFLMETYMILVRRIMLCNLGSFQATTFAIIVTGIEETFTRVTIEQRDLWYRVNYLKRKKPSEKELKQMRKTWACAVFHSMIAETSCIILSTIMYIIYADHRAVFNLGYTNAFEPINSGVLVLQMLLELLNELSVDAICTFVELKSKIDVLEIIREIDHPIVILSWGNTLCFCAFFALNTFKTVPNFAFCDSKDPCSCSKAAFPLYEEICSYAGNMTETQDVSLDVVQLRGEMASSSTFGSVENMTEVLVAIVATIICVVLFCLRTSWTRHAREKRELDKLKTILKMKELSKSEMDLVKKIMQDDIKKQKNAAFTPNFGTQRKEAKQPGPRRKSISAVTLSKLKIEPEDLVIVSNNIGRGALGDVHLAKWNNVMVAIKQLAKIEEETLREFRKEVLLMSQLRHPNIIALLGALWNEKIVGIVLEFAEKGSLAGVMRNPTISKPLTWFDPLLRIVTEVAMGMNYLHTTSIHDENTHDQVECVLHRDLKPSNVLLTSGFSAKVSDFGSSKALVTSADEMTVTGTPIYMAPEVVRGEQYNDAADVYSFGILLFAVTCEKGSAFNAFNDLANKTMKASDGQGEGGTLRDATSGEEGDTREENVNGDVDDDEPSMMELQGTMHIIAKTDSRPKIHCEYETIVRLISRCWSRDPSTRPTFRKILNFLQNKVKTEVCLVKDEKQKAIQEKEDEKGRAEMEFIETVRTKNRKLSHPVTLIRASAFNKFDKHYSLDELTTNPPDKKCCQTFHDMSELQNFLRKNFTIYFSHNWLNGEVDDASNSKLKIMQKAAQELSQSIRLSELSVPDSEEVEGESKATTRHLSSLGTTYIFLDYSCISQVNKADQDKNVDNLYALSSSLHSFVCVTHGNGDFFNRGWCKAELICHVARKGFENVFVASAEDGAVTKSKRDDFDIEKITRVFSSDFTCCENKHKPGEVCDKEKLVKPILGWYSDVYKHRLIPKFRVFYDAIESNKGTVFPKRNTVIYGAGGTEEKDLFGNFIASMERAIDFENMLEAAGGERKWHSDDGSEDDLDSEENLGQTHTSVGANDSGKQDEAQLIFDKDADFSTILLDPSGLQFRKKVQRYGSDGSEIYKAMYDGTEVDVKKYPLGQGSNLLELETTLARFKKECLFLKELKHTNVVMLVGAIWKDYLICVIHEHCGGGNVSLMLEKVTAFTWKSHKYNWALDISKGMQYLHNCVFLDSTSKDYAEGVIHRNLTLESVLLTADLKLCKISDFGASRVATENGEMTVVGKPYFMAPEIFRGERYDTKVDVYSFGVCLAELCQAGSVEEMLINRVKSEKGSDIEKAKLHKLLHDDAIRPLIPDDCGVCESIRMLMKDCWHGKSAHRPDFGEIVRRLETEVFEDVEPKKREGAYFGDDAATVELEQKMAQDALRKNMKQVRKIKREKSLREGAVSKCEDNNIENEGDGDGDGSVKGLEREIATKQDLIDQIEHDIILKQKENRVLLQETKELEKEMKEFSKQQSAKAEVAKRH